MRRSTTRRSIALPSANPRDSMGTRMAAKYVGGSGRKVFAPKSSAARRGHITRWSIVTTLNALLASYKAAAVRSSPTNDAPVARFAHSPALVRRFKRRLRSAPPLVGHSGARACSRSDADSIAPDGIAVVEVLSISVLGKRFEIDGMLTFLAKAHLIRAVSAGPAPRDLLVFRHNSSVTRKLRLPDSGSANQRFESSLPNRYERFGAFLTPLTARNNLIGNQMIGAPCSQRLPDSAEDHLNPNADDYERIRGTLRYL